MCLPETPSNIKELNFLLDKFPQETFNTIKTYVNSWMSDRLSKFEEDKEKGLISDDTKFDDRFPTASELNSYIVESKSKGRKVEILRGDITKEDIKNQTDKVFLLDNNSDNLSNVIEININSEQLFSEEEIIDSGPTSSRQETENVSNESKTSTLNRNTLKEQIDRAINTALSSGKNIIISEELLNTESELAKNNLELFNYLQDKLNSLLDTSTEEIKSFSEDMKKVSQSMHPITRKNRVNKITRMFSNRVTELLEAKKEELNKKIDSTNDFKTKREYIDELKDLSRFKIIKYESPSKLFRLIKEDFQTYLDATPEERYEVELEYVKSDNLGNTLPAKVQENVAKMKADRKAKAYQLVIDNWRILAEEAASNFALTEGVSMDINDDYVEVDDKTDSQDEEGKSQDDSVSNKEESYKDGWMTNVKEVSSYNSLSNRVRRTIRDIARLDKQGKQVKDDLGDTQYLEASYVHSELIQALKDMVTAEDMIPLIEKLAKRKSWANQILKAVKEDPRLFTSFYRAYRKDYLNYWIQKAKTQPDGSIYYQTISINKSEGTAHYFDSWRDNYEYGIILDDDSLYNTDGEIILSNAEKGLEVVNNLLDSISRDVTREEEIDFTNSEDTIKSLQKVLKMIGISVDDGTLLNSLNYQIDDERFSIPLRTILDNLRTIYYDLNKGNDKVIDGNPADLINIYGSAYNAIAEVINSVDEDSVESNVRQGDKTRYAHTNPSYITTLVKKFKKDDFLDFIKNEYKSVSWFYDEKHGWYNELLKELETNPEVREKLDHIVLLEFNKKEYANWNALDATLALINQYYSLPTEGEEGYAYYQLPMLSDSQSAEFIKYKRYIENFEEIITDKFVNVVKQELNRIDLVNKRNKNSDNVDKIANFDNIGTKFTFFPELNERRYNEDKESFIEHLNSLNTIEEQEDFIKEEIRSIMNNRFNEAKEEWSKIGLLERVSDDKKARYKYFNKYSESGVESYLKEWFWNSTFAQSQIIQLLTTDLAFYKNLEDFQKRIKQVHAPTEKLNTLATWNKNGVEVPVLERVPLKDAFGNEIKDSNGNTIYVPRKERVITLKDFKAPSLSLKDIEEALNSFSNLTEFDKSIILGKYEEINVADAQAYRSLDSFRATQIMADMWSEEEETAYENFKNGKWSAKDFVVLWNVRKPYLYTQKNQKDQVNEDGLIRVPTQHKNSELLLITNAIFGEIFSSSPKLKALDDFMTKNHIDLAQFESTTKVGNQGIIDINNLDTYEEVLNKLNKYVDNPNYVHEFDYNDYGIQTATPEHGIDAVQLIGTQIRRLIGADANANNDPNFKFKYGNKEWTVEQWFNYYNAANVANIRTAFESLDKKFSDIKEIEKTLLREVRSNPRYGTDLIQALTLDKDGNFNIPLNDPSQTLRIQALLNSILKSKVTKQEIQGGALIQASAYGLKREPKIVFEGEGESKRVKYMECYIPCPTEELYNLLLDPETHELDINKKDENDDYIVPRKYLEAIGYRVPTESKYSMAPLKVIGFLPRQVGSVIILPRDITTIAGSDFDVDKMYVMFHTLDFKLNIGNIKEAWDRFYNDPENKDIVDEIDSNIGIALEDYNSKYPEDNFDIEDYLEFIRDKGIRKYQFSETAQNRFRKWAYKNYNRKPEVINFEFEDINPNDKMEVYNNVKNQSKKHSKEQRDSLIIDLMWAALTHPSTAEQFLNPGGFDPQKVTARIVTIANSMSLTEFNKEFGSIENLKKLKVEELNAIIESIKPKLNPLTPNTWVTLHQRNMSGAALISIAANHNASHAIMQRTNLGVKDEYALRFNGYKYNQLNRILNYDNEYITRNVSGFLAAFVDNAKDPIAGDMNFNIHTADMAFTLLRLGVPVVTTGLIISQPVVKDIVELIMNDNVNMQEAINMVISKYSKLSNGEVINNMPSKKGINNYNFTDEELITNILAKANAGNDSTNIEEATFFSNQLKVAYMISKLNKLSSALGDLTQATRADTQNGAAGPYIADDIIKIEKVKDILDNKDSDKYPLTGINFIDFNKNEEQIINSELPILQAFFTYGVESTKKLFENIFPQYSYSYRSIITNIKEMTKFNRLDTKTINNIYNDIVNYYITQFPDFNKSFIVKRVNDEGVLVDTEITARDYYINEFPNEFKKFKEDHPELSSYSFINRLKVIKKTKYNPVPSIVFTNVGKVTDAQKEQYMRDWTTLLYINKETEEMAKKLFIYNCFKGFGFSPSGYSHLASTIIKMSVKDYTRTLKEVSKDFDYYPFIKQYIRNHLYNRQLVPDVSKANGEFILEDDTMGSIDQNTLEFSVNIGNNSSYELRQLAHPFNDNESIKFHDFIHINVKGTDLYFELIEEDESGHAKYHKVKPLGLKNQYVEYEYGVNSETLDSVIKESKDTNMFSRYTEEDTLPEEPNPSTFIDNNDEGYYKGIFNTLGIKPDNDVDSSDSNISKFESISPDIKDSYTEEEYCGIVIRREKSKE